MIELAHGDLLSAPAEALVNAVNTVGVMGGGIALQFKRAYPVMFRAYERACKSGEVKLGRMHVFNTGSITTGPRWIINFPTKDHWRDRSKLADVESGLSDFVRTIKRHHIRSVAVPQLGCGLGGLAWSEVRPRIEAAVSGLTDVRVMLYTHDSAQS